MLSFFLKIGLKMSDLYLQSIIFQSIVKSMDPGVRLLSKPWPHYWENRAVCKLKTDLTSQSLSFLVCEIVILIVSTI